MKEALKEGSAVKRLTVSMILNAIKNKELEKRAKLSKTTADQKTLETGSKLTDDEIIDVIGTEAKKRKESIEIYEKAGRQDLVKKENEELVIVMSYLPEQMGEDDLRKIVKEVIAQTGATSAKDMGKVVGAVMPKVKGKASGSDVSRIVKEELGA